MINHGVLLSVCFSPGEKGEREREMSQILEKVVQQIAEKITDSTLDGLHRLISRARRDMDVEQLTRKLSSFQGASVADLDRHLHSRNVGNSFGFIPSPRFPRTWTPTLDDIDRRSK